MRTCCVESTEDSKWSGKKMEGDEGLNTVECLRGRLLAERQASRVAKEQAESMGNKLVELEKKLRDEIKLRGNAERKLKILKTKLESLNISSVSGGSEQSYSSEKRQNSCRSSATSSASGDLQETDTKPHPTNPAISEHAPIAKDYDSQGTDNSTTNSNSGCCFPQNLCENPNLNSQDLTNDESRLSSSSSEDSNSQGADDYSSNSNPSNCFPENPSSEDLKNDESRLSSLSSRSSVREYEDDDGDFVHNSLALVPVNNPITSQARNVKPVDQSVIEALDALRRAREKVRGSMGTRQMVKVGPT